MNVISLGVLYHSLFQFSFSFIIELCYRSNKT